MRKLNLTKVLSEFLVLSTIALGTAQSGTIIGGNAFGSLSSAAPTISSSSVSSSSVTSITIYSVSPPPIQSLSWTLTNSYTSIYTTSSQTSTFYLYYYSASGWNPQPKYVTIPNNVHQVSISVVPYGSDSFVSNFVAATFPGSVLAGQTLTLYVAPLFNYKYSYNVSPFSYSNFYGNGIYGQIYDYDERAGGFFSFSDITSLVSYTSWYVYSGTYTFPVENVDYYNYDYTLYSNSIQNVTVELSNGTPLIVPTSDSNLYYVSSLASSSTIDFVGMFGMIENSYGLTFIPDFFVNSSSMAYNSCSSVSLSRNIYSSCSIVTPSEFPYVIISWQ